MSNLGGRTELHPQCAIISYLKMQISRKTTVGQGPGVCSREDDTPPPAFLAGGKPVGDFRTTEIGGRKNLPIQDAFFFIDFYSSHSLNYPFYKPNRRMVPWPLDPSLKVE